jgi:hypothetical protein
VEFVASDTDILNAPNNRNDVTRLDFIPSVKFNDRKLLNVLWKIL